MTTISGIASCGARELKRMRQRKENKVRVANTGTLRFIDPLKLIELTNKQKKLLIRYLNHIIDALKTYRIQQINKINCLYLNQIIIFMH